MIRITKSTRCQTATNVNCEDGAFIEETMVNAYTRLIGLWTSSAEDHIFETTAWNMISDTAGEAVSGGGSLYDQDVMRSIYTDTIQRQGHRRFFFPVVCNAGGKKGDLNHWILVVIQKPNPTTGVPNGTIYIWDSVERQKTHNKGSFRIDADDNAMKKVPYRDVFSEEVRQRLGAPCE